MSTKSSRTKPSSQGAKVVPCVRCHGDIQPYAGRAVGMLGNSYAHHPGQCADRGARETGMHQTAQLELFAWSCGKITPDTSYGRAPEVCDVAGSDRAAYVEHMRGHGLRMLATEPMIKLRKKAPAAPRVAPVVLPFKTLSWTEHYPSGNDGPDMAVQRRGQFWANGPDTHSVWAITYTAPASGQRPELVQLYVRADGSVTRNWSDAKSSRREANRQARYAA